MAPKRTGVAVNNPNPAVLKEQYKKSSTKRAVQKEQYKKSSTKRAVQKEQY
jgi:hypothetical protein